MLDPQADEHIIKTGKQTPVLKLPIIV
jgi:hypothetical protein